MEGKRSYHFSEEDKNFLLSLIFERKDTIDSKQIDGATIKLKNEAWYSIWEEYNDVVKYPRTVSQLKIAYKNFKAATRKSDEKVDYLRIIERSSKRKLSCFENNDSEENLLELTCDIANVKYENCDSTNLKLSKRQRLKKQDLQLTGSEHNDLSLNDLKIIYAKEVHEMTVREHEAKIRLVNLDLELKKAQLKQTQLDIKIKEKKLKLLGNN